MELFERYYSKVFLVTTAALLLCAAIGRQPGSGVAMWLLVLGVVLLGLPHGALDPMLARKAFGNRPFFSLGSFAAAYAVLALLYAGLWILLPIVGLASFLAISAYHFGGDWSGRGRVSGRFAYGCTIVTLPALWHPMEVARIYSALVGPDADRFVQLSQIAAVAAAIFGIYSAFSQWNERREDLFEFAGILAGAAFLPPLLFFFCYFCLLHSPRHLLETARSVGLTDLLAIVRTAFPLVCATLILAAVSWFSLPAGREGQRVLQVLFVGLAALTVPHMMLEKICQRSTAAVNTTLTRVSAN